MLPIFERIVAAETASIGTIGARTRKVFTGPPLVQYSFAEDSSETEERQLSTTSASSSIDCIALGNDEKSLAYSTTSVIKLIDLNTGRELRTLVGHYAKINAIAQSNRSVYVWASASADCTAALWDTRQHPANVLVRRLDRATNCVQFSPDNTFIAVGSDNLYMIDLRWTREMRSLSSLSQVSHVCFHPTEYLLATASEDRVVRFWDIDSKECVSQSDPADGPIRSIAFHPEGLALFNLTDRRCGAISWEPFDVVGQRSVVNCDHALSLAVDDKSVHVLSRSLSLKQFCVQTAAFSVLLSVSSDSSDVISESVFNEDAGAGNENQVTSKERCEDLKSEIEILMPTHLLQQSPQPFTIPPCEETFVASAIVAKPASSRPTSLKARRVPTSSAKSSIKRCVSGRSSLSANRNGKVMHATANHLPSTSSAPDARTTSQRKRTERESSKSLQVKNENVGSVDPTDDGSLLEEILQGHSGIELTLEQRRASFETLRQCWRSRGVESTISEAVKIGDPSLLVELLSILNHAPSMWNLSLCCAILACLDSLVASKHESYVEVALAALRTAISNYGSIIRENAQNTSHIGVDVTGEERHEKCVRCVKQLTGMRVKATLISNHMTSRHAREFNILMQIFDDTISPL